MAETGIGADVRLFDGLKIERKGQGITGFSV